MCTRSAQLYRGQKSRFFQMSADKTSVHSAGSEDFNDRKVFSYLSQSSCLSGRLSVSRSRCLSAGKLAKFTFSFHLQQDGAFMRILLRGFSIDGHRLRRHSARSHTDKSRSDEAWVLPAVMKHVTLHLYYIYPGCLTERRRRVSS